MEYGSLVGIDLLKWFFRIFDHKILNLCIFHLINDTENYSDLFNHTKAKFSLNADKLFYAFGFSAGLHSPNWL